MKMPYDLILVDLESNAKSGPDLRITEIGAARLERTTLREIDSFSQLVDGRPLTPRSIEITGITEEMLEGQPTFHVAHKIFSQWCARQPAKFVLSAWGTHFDMSALRQEYHRIQEGFPFPGKCFDVKTAALGFFWQCGISIGSMGVKKALTLLGLAFEGNPHRGLDDVRNEARILRAVMGIDPIDKAAQKAIKERWTLLQKMDQEDPDE
jgi:inhibitor of KinA sporulation pathway (predicted exonuclease)